MALWLLKRLEGGDWDAYNGFVVRADTEQAARREANAMHASEGPIWLRPAATSCEPIDPDGNDEVILGSFTAG